MGVVEKTGVPATSPIWPIPPHEYGEMGLIVLSTGTPVLSTTTGSHIHITLFPFVLSTISFFIIPQNLAQARKTNLRK